MAAPHEKLLQSQIAREFARYGRGLLRIVRGPIDVEAGGMAANALRVEHGQRMGEIIRRNVSRVFSDFSKETLRQLKVSPSTKQGSAIVAAVKGRADAYARDVLAQIATRTDDWTAGGIALWAADEQSAAIKYLQEHWIGAMANRRAATIAGNTVHQAASLAQEAASQAMMHETGKPLYRIWMTRRDSRVRPTHRAMHGLVAGPDEVFTVPRESGGHDDMRYPRDPRGSIENTANCRCYLRYSKTKPKGA